VERVTLASPAAARSLSSLRFTVRAGGGLVPQAQRDGSVALSQGGLPVLVLPAPFMTDARMASPAWTTSVSGGATAPEA
jgi:hypothetical protein